MAIPTSRSELKDYCLRKCGSPVIDINIDDAQVDDAIDDALHFWREYHFAGNERTYIKKQITQQDIDNEHVTLPDNVSAVRTVYSIASTSGGSSTSGSMFDITYQLRMNDLWDLSSVDMTYYYIARQYLSFLDDLLNPDLRVRFSQTTHKLNIDFNWSTQLNVDDYLLIEAFQWIDPDTFSDVWGHWVFRNLAAAYTMRQWGRNLNKFSEVQLPGGATMNAQGILSEAEQEIQKWEEEFIMRFQRPDGFYIS